MSSKYDAFISYRHSELDKFVATTLHKKLESFKLPKNVKSPTGKKKIERVFRDQDELPLASNLSDPITEALENSDYLLVICTPRLPESEWCKKEIETFIKLHGRDKVLAVLAEGEPEESFPEALTKEAYEVINPDGTRETKYRIFEPLAADVRGKNNKAIKKAMNDAILRICAAMFGLNYDELKQRHKERAMRRTISIVSAIAAALMLFSAVCMGLMFKIINQSEMILDQNAEIKKQYSEIEAQSKQIQEQKNQIEEQFLEAQINLAEATTNNAESLIKQGRKYDAVYALRRVMPTSSKDDSYPYTAKTEYALANALEVYADYDCLFSGRTFDSESTIEAAKVSQDYKKVATLDACRNLHVWDAETGKELFYKTLNTESYIKTELTFEFINSDTLLYSDNKKIYKLNLSDNTESEFANPNGSENFPGKMYRFLRDDKFVIITSDDIDVFDAKTGNCISTHSISEIDESLSSPNFYDVVLSSDGNTLSFSCAEAFKETSFVGILDIESDSLISAEIPLDNGCALAISDEEIFYAGSAPTDSFFVEDCYLYCLDRTTGKEKWKNHLPGYVYDMKVSADSTYIYATGYDCLYVIDLTTGDEINTLNAYSKVCNLVTLDNNGAALLTSDCNQYGYIDGYNDLYYSALFNNRPEITAEKFMLGYGNMFVQYHGTSYVSMFKYKDNDDEALFECGYSNTLCLNDADQFIRKESSTDSIELYSLDSTTPLCEMAEDYSYTTFVGDGSEYLANYGFGLKIYNLSDGSVVKEVPSLDVPAFDEGGVTNDRNYIYSGRDKEGHIFLYSLTTGAVEDLFKPDIPSDESITVYGLNKSFYAVKRESGAIEIYKDKGMKPVFTGKRLLSNHDGFRVFGDSNIFSIAYVDGIIEFYRFDDTVELIKTFNFTSMTSAEFDTLRYYPAQQIYVMNVNLKTLVFNEDLDAIAYLPFKANYIPSRNAFLYQASSGKENALFTTKRYSYDDLIYESNKVLANYIPSQLILEKYNLAD
ncbi:PQQ-like domain-containing protein [Lachnospiraceae bacterium G41]|nr:PQQ-like domain-containing protein [Lachnospiraceae bacterium G41]